MKKGLWFAVIPHLLGTGVAVALGWFIPTWMSVFESVRPAQFAFATVAAAWGLWKLYEILTDKDELARKTAKHFDSKK